MLVTLLGIAATSGRARANNDHPYPVGELASSMGGAGTATVRDGSAGWHNPGGLGRVGAEGISASVSVYGVRWEKTPRAVLSAPAEGRGLMLFPGAVGYVKPFGRQGTGIRHALGLSVVIPDYDRQKLGFDHREIAGSLGDASILSANGRDRWLQQSVWFVPGWGTCVVPRLCLGAALLVSYTTADVLSTTYLESSHREAGSLREASLLQVDVWAVTAGGQIGAQGRLTDRIWLGALLRSPMRRVTGGGRLLLFDSFEEPAGREPGSPPRFALRRAEETHPQVDRRLPWNLRVGAGFDSDRVLLAADARISFAQARYVYLSTADGAPLQPRDGLFVPVGDPVDVSLAERTDVTLNFNLGAQLWLTHATSLQAGVFTDRSGYDSEAVANDRVRRAQRYGLTLGVGRRGRASAFIGLTATTARTEERGYLDPLGSTQDYIVRGQERTILLNLGGSTPLGDTIPLPGAH